MARSQSVTKIVWVMLVVFSFICIQGVRLTLKSMSEQRTELSGTIQPTKVSFKLSTGVPGLALTGIGALGLLLLAIRVPVKEPVIEPHRGSRSGNHRSIMLMITRYEEYKLPVLLYWLLRSKLHLQRIEQAP